MAHLAAKLLTYLAEGLAPVRPVRIADVGANPIEAPPYGALAAAGLAEVWGFEPNDAARAKLEASKPDWLHVLGQAVGRPGRAVFNAYPASEMSSIFKLSRQSIGYLGHFRRHLGTETEVPVDLVGLDQLDDMPPLDLLKVDAQGAEVQVLQSGRGKLSKAVAVIAEMRFYRLYDGEPDLHELDAELRQQGFVLHKFIHQKSRMLHNSQSERLNRRAIGSQLIDGDAVYIRSLEDRMQWSDEQIAHLAFLAAGVFESHDLALLCLDELSDRNAVAPLAAGYVNHLPKELRA
ncbi:methyltransferase, FkbM family [Thalassovita gelatinovora]|uniref:Methyltransferase, FkbM family n=1 Tax=Thalassovita gelatinovora TaxID=53501 RepID=A0A0P1FRX2_THAGE|nr:FkbM family methyltransferase [Thalassovita gelatinovora]QIZ79431.1 FkbM family methyltransferase [Thalassovita gelatinovora]CUH62791.1 methyltransferase, FkbM family [Thalassovita gelatinovora]SEQ10262.1 methyltransferase, FkbM family [Thalassovita gelatinovora]